MALDQATICQRVAQRWGFLKNERTSWQTTWVELRDQFLPAHGRGLTGEASESERNKGDRRDDGLYDMTAVQAVKIAAAGLQSGLTSPSRPWFALGLEDPGLSDEYDVRVWLSDVEQVMRAVMNRSNLYNVLHHSYLELLAFGTSGFIVSEQFGSIIRCRPMTAGEYWVATDAAGRVNALYRQFWMGAADIKVLYPDTCSLAVRSAVETNQPWQQFSVLCVIEENDSEYGIVAERFPFRSIYMEVGATEKILGAEGYYEFPAMIPRWTVAGQDAYGFGAGHDCLGDAKCLQKLREEELVLLAKTTRPSMVAPTTMRNKLINAIPGGITYSDDPQELLRPLEQVEYDLPALAQEIQQTRYMIRQGMFNDLFLMLLQVEVGKMTATEVAARQQEKMLMLGPVLERLHNELLDPLIDRVFAICLRNGHLPPPPDALPGGVPIKVDYISPLALAQRQAGLNGLTGFTAYVGSAAAVHPPVLDKVDWDESVDEVAESLGVSPRILRDERDVAAIRQQRASQEQAQRLGQAALTAASAAKDASAAGLTEDSVLTRMLANAQGGQPIGR